MNTSEQIDALVAALAAARPHYKEIPKNRTVTVKSDRGAYEFSYGTLDKILEAVCPALAQQGVVPIFGTEYGPGGELWVLTRIYHTSGQWMETALNLGRADRTQDIGSRMTYGKRYGIQALLAVQADEDVDAEPESTQAVKPRATKAPTREFTPAVPQNGQGAPKSTPGETISSDSSPEPQMDRSALLGHILDAMQALVAGDAPVADRRKWQADLQEEYFGTRSWQAVQTKVKPSVLAEGLKRLQAKVNALQPPAPSPVAAENDVPDGLVPGSEEAWAALEERSRAIGWTGLQWQGAREHLGYADVLAEIVALEPDPSQPELI